MSGPERIPRPARAGAATAVGRGDASTWLTSHEASALVGVSEATLRRWAESGDVEAFVTPGGHRRFRRQAVLDLLPRPTRRRRTLRELGETPERVVRQYRRELASPPAWLPEIDAAAREAFREPGRRILAGVLGYLDAPDEAAGTTALETATGGARAYGHLASAHGLGLARSVEAFLRLRSRFLEQLGLIVRRRRVEASDAISLIIASASVFDRLLLALLDGHLDSSRQAHEPASRRATRQGRGK